VLYALLSHSIVESHERTVKHHNRKYWNSIQVSLDMQRKKTSQQNELLIDNDCWQCYAAKQNSSYFLLCILLAMYRYVSVNVTPLLHISRITHALFGVAIILHGFMV